MDVQRPSRPRPNPYPDANFFSKHFFVWFWPIFKKGSQRAREKSSLTLDDLSEPAPEDQAKRNLEELDKAWKIRNNENNSSNGVIRHPEHVELLEMRNGNLENTGKDENKKDAVAGLDYKVLRGALYDTFGREYLLVMPILVFTDCFLKVIQPLYMLWLVRSFIEEPRDEVAQYLYAAGVCLSTLFITLISNPCIFSLSRLNQRCRIALASLVQRKVLRLSAASQFTDQGNITNLVTNDAAKIETGMRDVPYVFVAPLQLVIFLGFLYVEFGLSSLAGMTFILLYMPFQQWNGSLSNTYRGAIAKRTDDRVSMLAEVIDAIQSVKMYAWEEVFQEIIMNRRKEEVKQLRKRSRLHAFQMGVFLTSSRVIPFLTFLVFVLLGGPLTADRVFYAVAMYNTITHYMVFLLPNGIRSLGEIKASLQRLQQFLQRPEKPSNGTSYKTVDFPTPSVSLNDVTAIRSPGDATPALANLNCQLTGNKLIMVVGKTACGKTSLLHLILNELHINKGDIILEGGLSYAPQVANLFPGTIRTSILNGRETAVDESRYREVLEAACLMEDIQKFGDKKKVAGLSGGQKARVNLARAMYHKANIYLLDDPLSSVDSKVSRTIFNKAIQGFLLNTLRILVTHQIQYLEEADHVIVMDKGQIVAQGKFPDVESTVTELLSKKQDATVDEINVSPSASSSTSPAAKNGVVVTDVGTSTEHICLDLNQEGGDNEGDDDAENKGEGALGLQIYWKYFSAGNSVPQLFTYFLIFIIAQVFTTLIEYWLALWTNAEERMYEESLVAAQTRTPPIPMTWQGFEHFLINLHNFEQDYYLCVYLLLTTLVFLTNLVKAVTFFRYCMRISTRIHTRMLKSLLRAQPSFFDSNPQGRIMNRFTKDVTIIDEQIPFQFFDMWTIFLQVGTVIILIIAAIWYSVVPVIVFLLLLGFVRGYYVITSRDLKRIDATTRSPIISHIQTTFSSMVAMRALGAENVLSEQFDILQDMNTSSTISFLAANQCFSIWIEILATFLLTFVAFGFLIAQNYLGMHFFGGNVGLAICSAMSLTIWLQYGMKVSADVENLMISVERAIEYTKLPGEASPETVPPSNKPPPTWPDQGKIQFENASLSYDKKRNILENLTFDVMPGEKIGIVGKTGAGKSSVLRALFRMTELGEGRMIVDGRDIKLLGLHDLRKCMVTIPQEPKLFKGTLKFNLDPRSLLERADNGSVSEDEMKLILKKIGLGYGLNMQIDSKGENLSFGERQLVSIARALLLKRKIICLDEATAHIDPGTDERIQRTLRDTLGNATAITIAHRLGTIIECDRILVLHDGKKEEYDHAHQLLENPKGFLTSMVNKTGSESEKQLRQRASTSWQTKREKMGLLDVS